MGRWGRWLRRRYAGGEMGEIGEMGETSRLSHVIRENLSTVLQSLCTNYLTQYYF